MQINTVVNTILFEYSIILLILILWFQTNGVFEYFGWIPFKVCKEYRLFRKTNSEYFVDFLSLRYNTFLIRLITCPFCLSFWLTLIFCSANLTLVPLVYIAAVTTYKLVYL